MDKLTIADIGWMKSNLVFNEPHVEAARILEKLCMQHNEMIDAIERLEKRFLKSKPSCGENKERRCWR